MPPAPNAQNNYYPSWLFKFVTETYGMLRFEHDFTPDITGYAKVGGRRTNGAFALRLPDHHQRSGAMTAARQPTLIFIEAVSADIGVRAASRPARSGTKPSSAATLLSTWTGLAQHRPLPAFTSNIYTPGLPPGRTSTRRCRGRRRRRRRC